MKARSLVFDLFGDYLRYRGGEVRLRTLIALMEGFDVPEATVRVVVTRMRKEGWLATRRDGRETVYALTEAAWQLLDEGRTRILEDARISCSIFVSLSRAWARVGSACTVASRCAAGSVPAAGSR